MNARFARALVPAMIFALSPGACANAGPARTDISARSAPSPAGWISHPEADASKRPVVLHFRRDLSLRSKPSRFVVKLSADNRFILLVNGKRVASGPSAGDSAHWRYGTVDLSPWLRKGPNVLTATVWNYVIPPPTLPPNATPAEREKASHGELMKQVAPAFQQSVATGFLLEGEGAAQTVSTHRAGWKVKLDAGRSASNGFRQVVRGGYYVAGAAETIDAAAAAWDAAAPSPGDGWVEAVPAMAAAERQLVADSLAPQRFSLVPSGRVVRTDLPGAADFPARPVTIPANSRVKLLLQREAMVAAYPELAISGGKGARIRLTYAEALYDEKFRKGDRNLIGDRKPVGISDNFLADGASRQFMPLWWRVWRYLEIEVATEAEPVRLEAFRTFETGYPFNAVGSFHSDDPQLDKIWQIGWRTAQIDAHETYMDSAFWEQLQYGGDTRLQMLISYAVSDDPRLAEQAIDAFAQSRVDGGLTQGAYPSRLSNIIPTFSLLWIGMLHDWWMHQPDRTVITRHLGRMREILAWFEQYNGPDGLLRKSPHWNFVDWVGQPPIARDKFPSWSQSGESCLMSASYLGALDQAAALEAALGDGALAKQARERGMALRTAIRARCWVPARGLYADDPDGRIFSQHMNALAVLYDIARPDEAPGILERITAPAKGIDAPDGVLSTSYYFAWYLVRAFEHAALADRYFGLLQTWRQLLALNYTTWPEERGNTRSDSHAWSAHPTADLLGIVAGIGPASPGYASLRVAPSLGALRKLDARAATPAGPVSVGYRIIGSALEATITKPPALPGFFRWKGRDYPLKRTTTRLKLSAS